MTRMTEDQLRAMAVRLLENLIHYPKGIKPHRLKDVEYVMDVLRHANERMEDND